MATFTATFTTTASVRVPIGADSAAEAQEIADSYGDFPFLCAHCSGWGQEMGIELSDVWEQDGEVESS